MRLLQVGSDVSLVMGGMARAIFDIRDALGGRIVSFSAPGLPRDPADGVIHIGHSPALAGRRYGWVRDTRSIDRLVEDSTLLIVHGLYRHHFQWAARRARELRRPYLLYPHGSLDPHVFTYRALQKELWWRWIGRPAASASAGLVFVTAAEAAKAGPRLPPGVRQHVVPLPVAVPAVGSRAGLRARALRDLGIENAAGILLFLGRLDPFKRVPVLIDAFNRANPPGWHLVIAGPEHAEQSIADCRRLVAAHVRERVHFTGPRYGDDKEALYAAADASVSISARENFGYSVCEALARAVPVLLGPGNDLASELRSVGCGWVLDRDDASEVARALTTLASTPPSLRAEMGERGRGWVEQNLSPQRVRERLWTLCEGRNE